MAQQSVFGRVQNEGAELIEAIGSITYHCVQEKFGKNSIRGKDFMRRPRSQVRLAQRKAFAERIVKLKERMSNIYRCPSDNHPADVAQPDFTLHPRAFTKTNCDPELEVAVLMAGRSLTELTGSRSFCAALK